MTNKTATVFASNSTHWLDHAENKLPTIAAHLDDARDDTLAFANFPRDVWQKIWSNNPNEHLNRGIRRRTDSVGIFPNRDSIIRLVGPVLVEKIDEWAEGRRYLGLDVLARWGFNPLDQHPEQEEPTTALLLSA